MFPAPLLSTTTMVYSIPMDHSDANATTSGQERLAWKPVDRMTRLFGNTSDVIVGEFRSMYDLDAWQSQAIKTVSRFGDLQVGWDGYGGLPPSKELIAFAIKFIADATEWHYLSRLRTACAWRH